MTSLFHKKTITAVAISILIGGFVGCQTTNVPVSNLVPQDKIRGYVEFFYDPKQNTDFYDNISPLPYPYGDIFKIEDGERISVGHLLPSTIFKSHLAPMPMLRVAVSPGTYSFVVKVGNAEVPVNVEVKEGMITPVRLDFVELDRREKSITYMLMTVVRKQVPYETPEAVLSLIESLIDKKWDVRWFSIVCLGQLGDPMAIKPLEKISKSDADPVVRKIAKNALVAIKKNQVM